MQKYITILMLLLACFSFSQDCQIEGKSDWKKVEPRTLYQREAPEGYRYIGEWISDGQFPKSLDDLSEKQLRKIKKRVAKFKACVVYLDFNGIMGSNRGLYYIWTNEPN